MSEGKWVVLTVADHITADIYKSLLESNDIPVFLKSDLVHSIHPFTVGHLGDVEVLVPEDFLAEANTLLEQVSEELPEEFDESEFDDLDFD